MNLLQKLSDQNAYKDMGIPMWYKASMQSNRIWCNGQCARLKCGRSWVEALIAKGYKIGICCFSAKHAVLRSKNTAWFARNQDNVSEWGDISTCKLLLQ